MLCLRESTTLSFNPASCVARGSWLFLSLKSLPPRPDFEFSAELTSAGQLGKRLFPRQCCWLQCDGRNVPELLEELPREKRFPGGSARENLPELLRERGSPLLAGAAGFAPLTTSLKLGICRVPPPCRLPSRTLWPPHGSGARPQSSFLTHCPPQEPCGCWKDDSPPLSSPFQ